MLLELHFCREISRMPSKLGSSHLPLATWKVARPCEDMVEIPSKMRPTSLRRECGTACFCLGSRVFWHAHF